MTQEQSPQERQDKKPDGERWLELLGYGHLKGQPTGYAIDGEPVPAEQFDRLCGEHIKPFFTGLESLGTDDPRFEAGIDAARKVFEGYFGPAESK